MLFVILSTVERNSYFGVLAVLTLVLCTHAEQLLSLFHSKKFNDSHVTINCIAKAISYFNLIIFNSLLSQEMRNHSYCLA